jgi:hypothetical protein
MEKDKPFRVRKAAYDVILVARDGWLRSAELRQTLEDLDFPRQLHSVVIETGRSDHQRSFLMMMEILSEDRYWHSYLRGAMDIWLPFRHEGPDQVLRILANVWRTTTPGVRRFQPPPLDKFLEKLVEDEWAGVPGRLVKDLTADRLEPLAEVTKQFKELLFTETDRRQFWLWSNRLFRLWRSGAMMVTRVQGRISVVSGQGCECRCTYLLLKFIGTQSDYTWV